MMHLKRAKNHRKFNYIETITIDESFKIRREEEMIRRDANGGWRIW